MARIHTLEDDITFERVRNLPRRTRVCSVHRQLSWACHKEIQLYAKDSKVTTNNLERSKTALQSRYRELVKVQTSMRGSVKESYKRRASCPAVLSDRSDFKQANTDPYLKSSIIAKIQDKEKSEKSEKSEKGEKSEKSEKNEKPGSGIKSLPRSISMYATIGTEKRSLNPEQQKHPMVQFNRQNTLST